MFQELDTQVAQILESPQAALLAERLNTALEAERRRRVRFYEEISEQEKAEFINGEVIIHSPVKLAHTTAVGWIYKLLDTYVQMHGLGFVGYEKMMVALTRNDYEPDIVFFKKEKSQHFEKGQWKFPAPDFVVEVLSKKTEDHDRDVKYKDYEAHGVEEYWIVDPVAELIEQYRLGAKGHYELLLKAGKGMIECRPVPGFRMDIEAAFDPNANFAELQRIMAG